eukprot:9248044-Alexandrium_andersonii.AAC.1
MLNRGGAKAQPARRAAPLRRQPAGELTHCAPGSSPRSYGRRQWPRTGGWENSTLWREGVARAGR